MVQKDEAGDVYGRRHFRPRGPRQIFCRRWTVVVVELLIFRSPHAFFSLFVFFPVFFNSFLFFFFSVRHEENRVLGYISSYTFYVFFFNVSVQVLVTSQKMISKYSIPFISLLCRNFYIRLCVRILCKCTCVCMSVLHVVNIQRGCALLLAGYHSLWPCLEKLD